MRKANGQQIRPKRRSDYKHGVTTMHRKCAAKKKVAFRGPTKTVSKEKAHRVRL